MEGAEERKQIRLPKASVVKNRAPAAVQITAEQILREAQDRIAQEVKLPKQPMMDAEEIQVYRSRKRKEFEDRIRMNRHLISTYVNYAKWEESQKEYARARSIFERALEVEYKNASLWLKYAEMEMRNKFVNHARNIWDRAVSLLPRIDQFWYKYAYMEEMVGNVPGARQVFERWMKWKPGPHAWMAYIKMEERYGEYERIRTIFEVFVRIHDSPESWLKYAKFESQSGDIPYARSIFERAIDALGDDGTTSDIFVAFAKFEERAGEVDRARCIFKYALDHLPKEKAQDVFQIFTAFEKQHGDRETIEDVILNKRRIQYEEQLKENGRNYDVWFDYIRLEESTENLDRIREVYERAISNVPPDSQKRFWRRYIFLWIKYAVFEELDAKDVPRARSVYREMIRIIPHGSFTFAKCWTLFARFEIRQRNLDGARKILGQSIGSCPKEKLFQSYIELEVQLAEFDRCRKLYEKYLEWNPTNCKAWCDYAEMEANLGEMDRCRAIYELSVEQPVLDMPEKLWKAYIDFEISEQQFENVRSLYRRLLQRTKHLKVWLSFAQFESSIGELVRARDIFSEADQHYRHQDDQKEERCIVLENWLKFEEETGDSAGQASAVRNRLPRRVKKRRAVINSDPSIGIGGGLGDQNPQFEEYVDYVFPDDEKLAPNLKILEMAQMWKRQKTDTA